MAEHVPDRVTRRLAELDAAMGAAVADPQLEAVRTALLIEDIAGVVLREDQIDPSVLGDRTALTALLTTEDD